ncbi:unannotated protein [freshwater metagenome]|uniref:Unannotated protein n=1 Tax=freshwater metagenome TaxID=449393 RepID=A0A6J6K6V0_9ZZZZ
MAVTIDLRFPIAVRINSRAGSIPPMTSMIRSIVGSLTMESASSVKSSVGIPVRGLISRTAIFANSILAPARVESSRVSAKIRRATSLPTTPQPSMPMRTGWSGDLICLFFHIECEKICLIFSADNHAGFSISYRDNRRTWDMVVIAGHASAICPCCRGGQ